MKLIACAFALGLSLTTPSVAAISGVVRIESGRITGVRGADPGVSVFKGIPYAAPPVGELRWRAPQPPLPWKGVSKAEQFDE